MPVALDVDPEVYVDAGLVFLRANGETCNLVAAAATAANAGGGMAGSDAGGAQWAAGYDGAAAAALSAGATLTDGLGHLGDLLDRTGANHAGADAASVATAHGVVNPPAYCTGTSTGPGAQSVIVSAPPSADATDDDPPAGWFLVAHLVEYTWPNGHQDRLRAVATGWRVAADALHPVADSLTPAIGDISALRSPEVEQAVSTCTTVQLAARDLADAYSTLGQTCDDYAGHLDDAHSQVIEELTLFAAESAGVQLLAAALAVPTAGGSEVAGQGVQLAKTAATAAKISRILQRLAEVVGEVTCRIEPIVTHVLDVDRRLQAVLDKASADFAAVSEIAAAIPDLPVIDLRATEGPTPQDGHTLREHVGKTAAELVARAMSDPRLTLASTFSSLAEAEWAAALNIAGHREEIDGWAQMTEPGGGRLALTTPLPGAPGMIYDKTSGTFVEPTGVTTVLKRDRNGGWFILTCFPSAS